TAINTCPSNSPAESQAVVPPVSAENPELSNRASIARDPCQAQLELSAAAFQVQLRELREQVQGLQRAADQAPDPNRMNLLVFEAHRDRLLAAFVMATGAAACGMNVSMFFTFWATAALRKGGQLGRKTLIERAFGWMLPRSANHTRLSQMDMLGMGRLLMKREMKKKRIADLDVLVQTAADLGVTIRVCEMSMQLMGIRREELIDYPNLGFCGVAKFVEEAATANTTLFL
ncbi:MAG: DsrE/DsrF/DrsH-like family protein, partial [Planctomycetaceae bacterium]|nr:DsrE/DsrF/DrsH-like family protein [Planctomycetaceae bacterium]